MKHRICLTFLIGCCLFALYAQDCDSKLKTARDFKIKKDYKHAIEWYKMVLNDCENLDENVYTEFMDCEKKTTDKNALFQLDQTSLECSGEGGVLVMDLKKAPATWSVSQSPEWLQLTDVLVEEKKAAFYVNANPKAKIRVGTIQLMSENGNTQDFTVVQSEGKESIIVQTDNLSFEGNGGKQTVIIDANFKWNYNTTASWLQLNQQNNTLSVTCLANDSVTKRNTTITISGKNAKKTIHVIQSEGNTQFSISGVTDSFIPFFAAGNEIDTLWISCNDTWQVKNHCPWVIITPLEKAITILCEDNPWAEQRSGSFDVVTSFEGQTKTIQVRQDGAVPKLERISLPSASGERNVSSVRPHYRSVFLKGNKGEMRVKVHTNVQNWDYRIITNEEDWISAEAFQKDSLLKLTLSDNNGLKVRESDIVFSAMGIQDTLNIRQNARGYRGIWDDYFESSERTWKTTRFFVDIFGAESIGFRMGGLAKRWKCVEFSLLNFAVEYAYKEFYFNWEPIVRGYLPLSRKAQRWAVFMGLGTSVNMFEVRIKPVSDPKDRFSYFDNANFLFELGAEFQWPKKDNLSSRIFYRYDGFHSLGISFDLYKWTKKYGLK